MGVVIRVTGGRHQGQEFLVEYAGRFLVGRASYAHLALTEDFMLSREHFQLEIEPPYCRLADLGSTNGTKVNRLRVERVVLREGDEIAAGDSVFSVHFTTADNKSRQSSVCAGCGRLLDHSAGTEPDGDQNRKFVSSGVAGGDFLDGIPLCHECEDRRNRFPETNPDLLIEELIGEGGMGQVYRAWQISRGRRVAIKMMIAASVACSEASGERGRNASAQQKAFNYFRREIRALRDMLMPGGRCHPNIVEFYDIFEINGQFQLVMEFVDGKNAMDWVRSFKEPLPIDSAYKIAQQLLVALQYAHIKGYVHRDVKPSNLLVMGPLHRPRVKLSDFGLAKNLAASEIFTKLTRLGDVGGSIGFLSPEHIREFGEIKATADIYCAAATLFYMLTGKYPYLNFDPHRPDSYEMILEHPAIPLRAFRPDAPSGLERVLLKALKKNPRDRWQSAREMGQALQSLKSAPDDRAGEAHNPDSSVVT